MFVRRIGAVEKAMLEGPELTAPRSSSARRFCILILFMLSIALPRAGFVIPGLRVPLPLGLLVIHALFWGLLFMGTRWPEDAGMSKVAVKMAWFAIAVGAAALLGAWREAPTGLMLIESATFLGAVPAFFLVVYLLREERDLRLAYTLVACCVMFAAAYGILQRQLGAVTVIEGITYTAGSRESLVHVAGTPGERRILSSYGDPNVFAAALVLYVPCLIGAYPAFRRGPGIGLGKLLIGSTVVLACVAMTYCKSRAGYAGLAVALAMMWVRSPNALLRSALPLVALSFVASELNLIDVVSGRAVASQADPRWAYAGAFFRDLANHPLGTGLGIGSPKPDLYGVSRLLPATSVWDTYNSFYFHLFSRTGLLGLASFLWLTVFVARDARRRLPLLGSWGGAAAGLLCGFVGVQIALLANPVYQLPGGGVNFWLALGLAYSTSRIDVAPPAESACLRACGSTHRQADRDLGEAGATGSSAEDESQAPACPAPLGAPARIREVAAPATARKEP